MTSFAQDKDILHSRLSFKTSGGGAPLWVFPVDPHTTLKPMIVKQSPQIISQKGKEKRREVYFDYISLQGGWTSLPNYLHVIILDISPKCVCAQNIADTYVGNYSIFILQHSLVSRKTWSSKQYNSSFQEFGPIINPVISAGIRKNSKYVHAIPWTAIIFHLFLWERSAVCFVR